MTAPTDTRLSPTQNLRVAGLKPLITPEALEAELPLTAASHAAVLEGRDAVRAVLHEQDPRLLVVVGPCSIHDPKAAMEYARRLVELKTRYADRLCILMRVYFEKPRTTVGWKGLINDPHLDGSFDLETGLRLARRLLRDITALGLPAATEVLDPTTPQYLDDLVSWAAIGARTIESQTHRQMASGLSMPVGFKNGTGGNLQIAVDAIRSAKSPHHFLGVDEKGRACVVSTTGNPDGHMILRGGAGGANYEPRDVARAAELLRAAGLEPRLMVDCSHANSGKKHQNQQRVWNSLLDQRRDADPGAGCIVGAMIESNLEEGNQAIPDSPADLRYGVSITDACIGWEETEQLLADAYRRLG